MSRDSPRPACGRSDTPGIPASGSSAVGDRHLKHVSLPSRRTKGNALLTSLDQIMFLGGIFCFFCLAPEVFDRISEVEVRGGSIDRLVDHLNNISADISSSGAI